MDSQIEQPSGLHVLPSGTGPHPLLPSSSLAFTSPTHLFLLLLIPHLRPIYQDKAQMSLFVALTAGSADEYFLFSLFILTKASISTRYSLLMNSLRDLSSVHLL